MTQFSPRLTSASASPWVATTRPFLVATITEQPVPQKRQGALAQRSPVSAASVVRFCASAGTGRPAAAAAAATACALMTSRRVIPVMGWAP